MICRAVGLLLAILLLVSPLTAKDPPTKQEKPSRWSLLRPDHIPYPASARQAVIAGEVRIRMRIERDYGRFGNPSSVEVVSGHPLLADPAREAALSWVFWRGKGKTDWFFATIRFQIQERILNEEEKSLGEILGSDASFFARPALITVVGDPLPLIVD